MKKAFTLIELLLVIAIIAIVSTLAVGKVGSVREAAARKVSLANQKAVERGVEAFLSGGGRLNRLDSLFFAQEGASLTGSRSGDFEFNLSLSGANGFYTGPSKDDPRGTYREKYNVGLSPALTNVLCYYSLSRTQVESLSSRVGLSHVVAATAYADASEQSYPSLHYPKDRANGDGSVPNATDGLDPNGSFCVVTVLTNGMLVAAVNPMTPLGRTVYQACGQELRNTKNWNESYVEDEVRAEVAATGGPLIAFGLGDECSIVGNSAAGLEDAPYATFLERRLYSRYLVLFRLRTLGSGSVTAVVPEFAGVLDPCGNTIRAARHMLKTL